MKNKLLWLDLAVCSVWLLAILGSRYDWNSGLHFVAILTAVMRLAFTFVLAKGDKRAWLPLGVMMALGIILLLGNKSVGIHGLVNYPFHILNVETDKTAQFVIGGFGVLWIWLLPVVLYLWKLFRKELSRTDLQWTDLIGGILWKDRRAGFYSALLLLCIVMLYTGLAMNARACRIVCLTVPVLSFWLIARYYNLRVKRLWILVVAMGVFFYAQPLGGMWRVVLLAVSFSLVVYMGCLLYQGLKKHVVPVFVILYVGVFLPSLAIGYNPYACIAYGRYHYFTHQPYEGIFYVKDGQKIGLRDRYGLLVRPEYEYIRHSQGKKWYNQAALCKDGYVTLYDIDNAQVIKNNDIDGKLQADVCRALNDLNNKYGSEYDDRIEVKVTEIPTGKVLAHVKAAFYGLPHYDYSNDTFLPEDSVTLQPGKWACDTLVRLEYSTKKTLSYAWDIPRDSMALYRIYVKMAKDDLPEKDRVNELAEIISESNTLKTRNGE